VRDFAPFVLSLAALSCRVNPTPDAKLAFFAAGRARGEAGRPLGVRSGHPFVFAPPPPPV